MSDNSTILSLPLIQASQAQKHVTHNEAIRRLDALVQPVVQDMDLTDPPALPDEGARHIVAAGAAGEWLGQDGKIAVREGNAWTFIEPADGWRAHVTALGTDVVRMNSVWAVPPIQADMLGINATADSNNRLSISAPATLLTHEGAGHQLKINKASAGETSSLLFQTNWSGRAEMGTSGNDDFAIKVSSDGASWAEALRVDADSGTVTFPSGAQTSITLNVSGRWHCNTSNDWMTFNDLFGATGENFNEARGAGAEPSTVWNDSGVFIAEGTRLTALRGVMRRSSSEITGIDIRVIARRPVGTTWAADTDVVHDVAGTLDDFTLVDGWNSVSVDLGGFAMPKSGLVSVFIKPRGTITSTEYLYVNMQLAAVSEA